MLTCLRIRDFRIFEELTFHPDPGANFLIGPNAQGKTSLLEAVCLLLRLQSPRTSSPGECVRFGCDGFGLDGEFLGRHLAMKFQHRLKHFSLDSKPQAATAEYLNIAKVAWFANTDLELVRGGGAARRRYLDFLGVQTLPGYLRNLRAYERSLRSRNALLKEGRPRREVEAFDGPLITTGNALIEARSAMCAALAGSAHIAYSAISASNETFELGYCVGAEGGMAEALRESRGEEERLRVTVRGPHRDEVEMRLGGKAAGTYASEGQQRSIALGLKLAQARELSAATGREPVYLIDDVFGELDAGRRVNLLKALPEGAQKLITTTSLDWLEGAEGLGRCFEIRGGKIDFLC